MIRKPLPRSRKPIPKKRKKARRVSVLRDRAYLNYLRSDGMCVACQVHCIHHGYNNCATCRTRVGYCDPAHGPVNGMSSKGPDNEALPLCRGHHEYQTDIGWPQFEAYYRFSRETEAAKWYALYQESKKGKK